MKGRNAIDAFDHPKPTIALLDIGLEYPLTYCLFLNNTSALGFGRQLAPNN